MEGSNSPKEASDASADRGDAMAVEANSEGSRRQSMGDVVLQASAFVQAKDDSNKMQSIWQKTTSKGLKNRSYSHVGVLVIRWADTLGPNSTTANEAEELEEIFQKDFRFECTQVVLDGRTDPQRQLNRAVHNHTREHDALIDGQHHLLIVYYTGHGAIADKGGLLMSGDPIPGSPGEPRPADAMWTEAEEPLIKAKADVLVIIDSCHAASLLRGGIDFNDHVFEVLVASAKNAPTSAAGPRSFTSAMIKSLERQAKQSGLDEAPFNTWDLMNDIREQRLHLDAALFPRFNHRTRARHIQLTPLKICDQGGDSSVSSQLTLTFKFGKNVYLGAGEVKHLADELCGVAGGGLDILSIDWVQFVRDPLSMGGHLASRKIAQEWRKSHSRRRKADAVISDVQQAGMTSKRRKRGDGEENGSCGRPS